MSQKSIVRPFTLLNAVDMSDDHTSEKITDIRFQDNIGFQVVWSGATGAGEIIVEVSNDEQSPSNWTELDFGSSINTSGASGSHVINVNQCPFANIRVRFESNGSTGSLTVTITGKAV